MTEYLKIEVDLRREPGYPEICVTSFINRRFHKEDLFFSAENRSVSLYLNRADTEKLASEFNQASNYCGLEDSAPFLEILEKVESIKSYGVKTGKRLYVDYSGERKIKGRKQKAESRGAHYYARNNNFSRSENFLPDHYTNRIVCGDSEQVLKELPDNCIDLVVTSPPYNFGLEYESNEDGIDWGRYFEKLFAVLDECIRVVKFGGRIIVNVQPLYSDFIPLHHIISSFFMERKMIWRNEILWEKNNYNAKYTAWGSWKSPSNPYLKYTWEFLEVFSKGDLKHKGDRAGADISDGEFKQWVNAKWSIAPERRMREYGHPAMFPESLVERVLKLFSFKGDAVLDPFNGVGTTTKVAAELGRRYLGIDISEEYVRKAVERTNQET